MIRLLNTALIFSLWQVDVMAPTQCHQAYPKRNKSCKLQQDLRLYVSCWTLSYATNTWKCWQLRFQCQRDMKTEKPGWLKRRLVWPLKLHILRSLPFKVGAFLLIKAFITWARCFFCGLVLPPTGQMSDLMQMVLADGFLCLAATGEVSSNMWTWIWVRDWDNNCNTLS